jgi:hypothetical protein
MKLTIYKKKTASRVRVTFDGTVEQTAAVMAAVAEIVGADEFDAGLEVATTGYVEFTIEPAHTGAVVTALGAMAGTYA